MRCMLLLAYDVDGIEMKNLLLITQRRLDEAVKWLAKLLQLAEAQGRTGSVIEILMLHAEALQASGEMNQAMERLSDHCHLQSRRATQ
ncbi:MAG: hypothetical protein NVSMB27_20650 [Ktedonobacteraceae bacterium]